MIQVGDRVRRLIGGGKGVVVGGIYTISSITRHSTDPATCRLIGCPPVNYALENFEKVEVKSAKDLYDLY